MLDDGSGSAAEGPSQHQTTNSGVDDNGVDLAGTRPRGRAVGYVIGWPNSLVFAGDGEKYFSSYVNGPLRHDEKVMSDKFPLLDEAVINGEALPWFLPLPASESETATPGAGGSEAAAAGEESKFRPEPRQVNPSALAQLAHRGDLLVLGPPDGLLRSEGIDRRWRGTMHIDILSPWQGAGWGRKMIDLFVATLREQRALARGAEPARPLYDDGDETDGRDCGKGFVIGIASENARVIEFYTKCGFSLLDDPKDGGLFMVKDV